MIASAIGMSLSLDGLHWDGNGVYYPDTWLTPEASEIYANRSACFVAQYDSLCHPDIPGAPCVNGAHALKYSIADNVGASGRLIVYLLTALRATYEAFVSKRALSGGVGGRVRVPDGVSNSSATTLTPVASFMLAYAHGLCSDQSARMQRVTSGILTKVSLSMNADATRRRATLHRSTECARRGKTLSISRRNSIARKTWRFVRCSTDR